MKKDESKIVFRWLTKHKNDIEKEQFDCLLTLLLKEDPELLEAKRKGRRPATNDPEKIVADRWMNMLDDYSGLSDIFAMFGETGKDLARMAVCLTSIGFFRSENDNKHRFSESGKAIYNLVCDYKEFSKAPVSYEMFARELNNIYTIEVSYTAEERERDKKMMEEALNEAQTLYEEFLLEYVERVGYEFF